MHFFLNLKTNIKKKRREKGMENSVDYLVFSLTSTSYAANAADMKTVVLSAFRIQYSV